MYLALASNPRAHSPLDDPSTSAQPHRHRPASAALLSLLPPRLVTICRARLKSAADEGTTVKSVEGFRNSWEIWKEKMSERELAHDVSDFVAKREDGLVQEERWRNKMMRRLGDKFDHMDERMNRMGEQFEFLASTCAEINENVRSLQLQQTASRRHASQH